MAHDQRLYDPFLRPPSVYDRLQRKPERQARQGPPFVTIVISSNSSVEQGVRSTGRVSDADATQLQI
ncbi:hypothetical protein N7533_001993 [Penicillium manginii]|uniref:uncharacterized protein n=1 Tax=Penicillium manginii TaxID=203109 RepID=UPI002548F820|nr:uncharacterized protein N7533_001993 [Penicillium manginii]KAJ5763312.1 hypothetical protein N7533_001993 [Penicillium manginii]